MAMSCAHVALLSLYLLVRLKKTKPLTVTNPNMTRFMMSLEDSVDLVLYAFKDGNPGDIFVQKSPAATIRSIGTSVEKTI